MMLVMMMMLMVMMMLPHFPRGVSHIKDGQTATIIIIFDEYDGVQDDDYDYDSDNISPSLVTFLHIKDGQTAVHSVVNPVFSSWAYCLVGIIITDDDDYDDYDDEAL